MDPQLIKDFGLPMAGFLAAMYYMTGRMRAEDESKAVRLQRMDELQAAWMVQLREQNAQQREDMMAITAKFTESMGKNHEALHLIDMSMRELGTGMRELVQEIRSIHH